MLSYVHTVIYRGEMSTIACCQRPDCRREKFETAAQRGTFVRYPKRSAYTWVATHYIWKVGEEIAHTRARAAMSYRNVLLVHLGTAALGGEVDLVLCAQILAVLVEKIFETLVVEEFIVVTRRFVVLGVDDHGVVGLRTRHCRCA